MEGSPQLIATDKVFYDLGDFVGIIGNKSRETNGDCLKNIGIFEAIVFKDAIGIAEELGVDT